MSMRAVQLTAWHHPPQVREVNEPDPGPGEVVVKIGAAGVCHSDLHLLQDFEPGMMPFEPPFTLGHENAGWVEATGPGVRGLEVGQPVAVYGPWGCGRCRRCRQGMENYCERQAEIGAMGGGLGRDGGMAPLMLVPDARLLAPLDGLDPAVAAPLTDAGLTPYHAVKRSLPLLVPGSSVVVIGIGGLGHMAVQILRALTAAHVIAVDQRESALALARDLGADYMVVADDDAADNIRGLTRGGQGADVVIDLVGVDDTLALGAAVTRSLGHLTLVGIGGGSLPFSFFSLPYEVSLATTYWGSAVELMEVLALAEAGHIRTHVQRFDLDEAPTAYEQLAAGKIDGRGVVVP
jgi:alcohol dehydrogenase, propanol-preferring